MLVGIDTPDDAGIYRLDADTALVQTLDFLTPVTDNPRDFGRIAAANSLSDVYAMGGVPLTAMNIVCFSTDAFEDEVLQETLAGGLEKIDEAGAALIGGHSVDDPEFKYGLSVTGRVHPKRFLRNTGIKPGDLLILTKPIGTGVIATALKAGMADENAEKNLVDTASMLNKKAAEIMLPFSPSACTDITGFGLAGHLLEMASGSKMAILVDTEKIPMIERAGEYAAIGLLPAGAYKNREWCGENVRIGNNVSQAAADLIFDPQTSGGLLISMQPEKAKACLQIMNGEGLTAGIIGEVRSTGDCGYVEAF